VTVWSLLLLLLCCVVVVRPRGHGVVVRRGHVSEVGGKDGGLGAHHCVIMETTTNDDNFVVVRRLVATSPSATWHLDALLVK
jgi:hypothetical protein